MTSVTILLENPIQILATSNSSTDDPRAAKLIAWAAIFSLIGLASLVYKLVPNLHRQIGKVLLIAGFLLVTPMLSVVWTGHSGNIDDWSERTKDTLLISFGLGVLFVMTGGAFWYVRHKREMLLARQKAWENRAAIDAERSKGFPVITSKTE